MPQRLDQIIQAAKSPGSLTPAPMRASQLSPVAREVFGASLEGERSRDEAAARQQRLVEQETARRRAQRQEKRRTRSEETQKEASWINDSAVSAYASAVDRPTMKGPDGRLMPADSEEDWNRTLQTRQADIAKEEATKRAKELETAKAAKLATITNEEKTLGHRLTDPALKTLSDTEREKKRVAADEARLSATMTLLPEVEKRIETRYAGDKEATRSALEAARIGQADPEILAEIERDMPEHFAGERTLRDELGRDDEIRKQRDDLEKQRFSVSGKALELSQRDPLAAATGVDAPKDRFEAERVKLEFEQRQQELAARSEDIATRKQGLQANHEATVAQINAEYQAALGTRLTQPEVAVLTAKRKAAMLAATAKMEIGTLDLTREESRLKIEEDEHNRTVEALNRPQPSTPPAATPTQATVIETVETPEGPRESVVIDRDSPDMASSLDAAPAAGHEVYLRPRGVSVTPLDEATVLAATEKAKRIAESAASRQEEEMKPLLAAMASGSMTEEEARAKGEEKQRTVLASVHDEISAVKNETLAATREGKLSVGQYRTIMKELGYPPAAADEVLKEVTTRETDKDKALSDLQAIYAKEDLKHKDLATSSTRRSRETADRITGKDGAAGVGRVIVDHTMPVAALINLFRDSRDDEKKAGRVAAKRADLKTSLDTAMTNREAEANALLAQYPSISDEDATRLKLSAANNALRVSSKGFEEIMAGAVESPEKYLPFVGDYVGLALELSPVIEAAHKVRNGEELTGTDEFFLQSYIDESGRDMTALGIAAEIVAQMPAFAVEIGTTAGTGAVVRKGLGAATTKIVGKELMDSVAKWGASRSAKSRLIGRGARSVLDTTLATPLAMQDFIVANTIRRMELPELEDFTGDAHAWIAEPGVGFGQALLASGFDAWKEMVSETAGGAVGAIGNATMNRLAKASWVQAARKLNNSVPVAAISKLGRRAQIHGPLTELAEERIGDLIGATGHALSGGMVGEEFQWPSPEQWAGEAIGMMVPGAVFAVANHRATKAAIRENRASFEAAHDLVNINWNDPGAAVDGINGLLTGSGVPVSPLTVDELSAIESQIGPLGELPAVRRSREIEERLGGFMEDAESRDDLETLGRATTARLSGTYQQTKRAVDTILTHRAVAQHASSLAEMGDLESAALATGAAKLAAGRPLAELTSAERTVLLPQAEGRPPVALPDGTVQPAPLLVEEVNGVPVVTDAGKSAVSQVLGANLTDALLPMNEAKARRKALNPVPVWKPSSSSSSGSPSGGSSGTSSPSSKKTSESTAPDTVGTKTTWKARGERGTVVEIPADAANSLEEAETKLAGEIARVSGMTEALDLDSVEAPSVRSQESRVTGEERDQEEGADDLPGLRPLDEAREKLQQIVDDAKLSEQQRKKGEFVLSVLERIGATGILPAEKIEFTTDPKDGPMGITRGGILRINLELLDKHTDKGLNHFGAAVIEELIHAVAVQKLDPGLVAQTWQNLPLNLKNYVLGAYTYRADADALTPPGKLDNFQLGHEFLRMVIQDRAFQGKVTEAMAENPGFAAELRELLRQLVEALRSLVASLPAESRGQVETQVNIVIDALREMGVEVGGESVTNQSQSASEATTTSEANPSILTPLTDWIGAGTVADIGPVFLAMNPGFPGHDKGLHRWIRKQVGGDTYDASSDQEKFESVAEAILSGKYRARLQPGPLAELLRQYRSEVPEGTEALDNLLPPPSQEKPPLSNRAGSGGFSPLTESEDAPKIVGTGDQTETPVKEPRLLGSTGTAYTSTGEPVEFQWAIVEADDTITSHSDSLAPNPEYDQSLQGRNRDSAASAASIADIEKNTTFNRLSDSSETSSGAPIVGPDLVVESGNGRSIALRRAYKKGLPNAVDGYRTDLLENAERYGFTPAEVEALAQPVLVRIRRSDVDRAAFAEDANRPVVAQMSAKETALADAKGLPSTVLEQLEVTADGDLYTPANLAFFQRFFRLRVSPGELPGLVGTDGRLSRPGLDRVRNAVFVAAYGSDARAMRLFDRLAEEIDPNQRNIVNALLAAGPSLARYRSGVEAGSRHASALPEDLLSAADEFIQSRAEGHSTEEWLGQQRMFDEIPPNQVALIRFMDENIRSAKRLSAGFRNVITLLERAGNPSETDMFGEQGQVDYPALLGRGIETAELIGAETQGEMALGMGKVSEDDLNETFRKKADVTDRLFSQLSPAFADVVEESVRSGKAPVYPGLEKAMPAPDLSREDRIVEATFFQLIAESPGRAMASYLRLAKEDFGSPRYLNSDLARSVLPEYAADPWFRTVFDSATIAPAGYITLGLLYPRFLVRRKNPNQNRVVMLAGGPSSGKTTVAQMNLKGVSTEAVAIVDSVMGAMGGTAYLIDSALKAGIRPEVNFIYRPFESSGLHSLFRLVKTGRPVNIEAMARLHRNAMITFFAAVDRWGDAVRFAVHANDGNLEDIRTESLEFLRERAYHIPDGKGERQEDELAGSLGSLLDREHSLGNLSGTQYAAARHGRVAREDYPGTQRGPETDRSTGRTSESLVEGSLGMGLAAPAYEAEQFELFDYRSPDGGIRRIPRTKPSANSQGPAATLIFQGNLFDGVVDQTEYSPETPAVSSVASRSRPRDRVSFGREGQGITGPSGNKLLGYSWAWTLEEDVDNRGEDVVRRVSDWEKSELSGETGREIVHQFEVETPAGDIQTMSLESAAKALGFGASNAADSVAMKRVGNAAKNYAKAKMRLDMLESFAADVENWNREFEARKSEIAVSRIPEPVIEWSEADRVYNITLGEVNVGWRLPSQSAKVESGEWLREISPHERENWRDQWRTNQVMAEMPRPQPVAGPGIPYDVYAGIQSARKAVERNEKLMSDAGATVDAPSTDSPHPALAAEALAPEVANIALRMGQAPERGETPLPAIVSQAIVERDESARRFRDPAEAFRDITGAVRPDVGAAPRLGERGLLASGEERRKHGRELAGYARVLAWAEENGLILDPAPFVSHPETNPGGGEHKLIFDEASQRYVKLTKPGYFGYNGTDGGEYLQRWALANRVFGDEVAFEGFVKLPGEEDFRAVISQPFVEGRDANPDEVEDFLDEKGFHPMDEGRRGHPIYGVEAFDWTTPGNVIVSPDGQAHAVDLPMSPLPRGEIDALRVATGKGSGSLRMGVEIAAAETDTNPTEAQAEAGNYRKGKVTIQGLPISIENPRGSERSGTDKNGKAWSVTMAHHYGYIRKTEGKDGDHIDVFIGPDPELPTAYVINQRKVTNGHFDEHKVMLGFPDRAAAIAGYRANYSPGWRGLASMVTVSVDDLKAWLRDGDTTKPFTSKSVAGIGMDSGKRGLNTPEYSPLTESADPVRQKQPPARQNAESPPGALSMGYSREADDEAAILASLDHFQKKLPAEESLDERRADFDDRLDKAGVDPSAYEAERESAILYEAYLEGKKGQTHEAWFAAAERLIKRDANGVARELLEAARERRPLESPVMVKAAQIMIPRILREALATGDRAQIREAYALQWADLEGGTSASHVLGARRKRYANNADRHRDILMGLISRVPPKTKLAANAAKTPAQKNREIARIKNDLTGAKQEGGIMASRVIDLAARIEAAKRAGQAGLAEITRLDNALKQAQGEVRRLGMELSATLKAKDRAEILGEAHEARLAKVERVLAEMGLTLHDLFSHQAVVHLRGSEIVAQVIEQNFSAPQRAAIRFSLPPEGLSDREVSKRTQIKRDAVPGIMAKFRAKMEARFMEFAKKGLTLNNFLTAEGMAMFDLTGRIGEKGESLAMAQSTQDAPLPISEAEAKRATKEMMDALFGPGAGDAATGTKPRSRPGGKPFDLGDRTHVAQVSRVIHAAVDGNVYDALFEYWINNILSGPQTHAVNITGNGLNILMEYGMQRWMEATFNQFIGDPKGATYGEYGHMLRQLPKVWGGAMKHARQAWLTEESYLGRDLLNEPVEVGGNMEDKLGGGRRSIPDRTRAILGLVGPEIGTAGAEDLPTALIRAAKGKGWQGASVGRTVRIPGRALLFMDTLFKGVVIRTEVVGQAYRRGRAQGLQGAALESYMQGQVGMPGSESWLAAAEKGDELTFTNELKGYDDAALRKDGRKRGLDGAELEEFVNSRRGGVFEQLVKAIQDKRQSDSTLSPLAASLIGWFFPFIRTPFNIYKAGLRRTPFGLVGVASHLLKSGVVSWRHGRPFMETYGRARMTRDMADQTIAMITTWILWGITEGDDDDDEKTFLVTGSRPYGLSLTGERQLVDRMEGGAFTIRWGKANDPDAIRFDYSRLEPFTTVLGSIADTLRSIKRVENGAAKVDELAKFHQYALSQATDKTFLQGLLKIGELMEPGRSTGSNAGRTLAQAIVPNLVRQPLRLLDDYARESRTAPWYYHALPLGGFAEPKMDLYGQPMEKGGTPFAKALGPLDRLARIPVDTGLKAAPQPHVADVALRNWNRMNPDKGDQYFPSGNIITTFTDIVGNKHKLTAAQLAEVERIGGTRLRVMLAQQITPAEAANPTEETKKKIARARDEVFSKARDEVVKRPAPAPKRGRSMADIMGWTKPAI